MVIGFGYARHSLYVEAARFTAFSYRNIRTSNRHMYLRRHQSNMIPTSRGGKIKIFSLKKSQIIDLIKVYTFHLNIFRCRKYLHKYTETYFSPSCVGLVLGGLVVNVNAIGPKVRGLKPGRGVWPFMGKKSQHAYLPRGTEPSAPCPKILRHVKKSFDI
jgi:hypothetical protein